MNHLAGEKSPYLLQHAHNPVDWYPWGEAAFHRAKAEDKPIFLSVGYSTCHWCHVMERESFENSGIAERLNQGFVSIKVDREERPDVDQIYMAAVQAMTGQGGWPLSAFLTPELKPFFGGTYFPPESRWGRPGFAELLDKVASLWKTDRAKLSASGNELGAAVARYVAGSGRRTREPLSPGILDRCLESYRGTFDPVHGGFGGAPKFLMPLDHEFLLRVFARAGSKEALEMSLFTLRGMARGGVYDRLGGGFHRYSTDEKWHVPHFEKMLYDNAQLASAYLDAYRASGDEALSKVARATLDYVLRDMTDPLGGFYSAEDADSEGREGAFYVWNKDEILKILGHEAGEIFSYRYGIESQGNAEQDPQGEFRGENILYEAHPVGETARKFGKSEIETAGLLDDASGKLLAVRNRRPRPHRDDKILISWNGLMIAALAKAGAMFEDPRYAEAARKAARFVLERMYDPAAKRLYRRWRTGDRGVPAMADDYAFLVRGLIELYESDFDPAWLDWAVRLTEEATALFHDAAQGGVFLTAVGDDANLLARIKPDLDGVEPSANSATALNLLRLSALAGRTDFRRDAERIIAAFADAVRERPRSFVGMLAALDFIESSPRHVVVAGDPAEDDARALLREIRRRYLPNTTVLMIDDGAGREPLSRELPFIRGMKRLEGRATAYVCVDYVCRLPTTDPMRVGELLNEPPKEAR